jgi:hypothetical protein
MAKGKTRIKTGLPQREKGSGLALSKEPLEPLKVATGRRV